MSRRFSLSDGHTVSSVYSISASQSTNASTANQIYAGQGEVFGAASSGICSENFQDYPVGPISIFDKGIGWGNPGTGISCSIVQVTGSTGRIEKRLRLNSGSMYVRNTGFGKSWSKTITGFILNQSLTSSYTASHSNSTTTWTCLYGMALGATLSSSANSINPPGPLGNSGSQYMGGHYFTDNQDRINPLTSFVQYNQTMSYLNMAFHGTMYKISGSTAYPTGNTDTGSAGTLFSSTSSWGTLVYSTITRPDPVGLAAGSYTLASTAPNTQTVVGHNSDLQTILSILRAQGNVINFADASGTTTNLSLTENGRFLDSAFIWWGGSISGSRPESGTFVDVHGIICVKQF